MISSATIVLSSPYPRVWNVWTAEVAATIELRRLTSHSVGQAWGGSGFPDNRRLAYSHKDRLLVLDTISGDERVFPSTGEGQPGADSGGVSRWPVGRVPGVSAGYVAARSSDGTMRRILEDPSAKEFPMVAESPSSADEAATGVSG